MSPYVTFEAVVEPMRWGKSNYTVVRLVTAVMDEIGPAKRVEGEFNEHPVNLAVTRAPAFDEPFLWAGKSLLDTAGLTPGLPFEARLRAADPDLVNVPPDLLRAIRSAGASEIWEGLSAGKQRGLIHTVETAKRAETRARRIMKLLADLT